MAVIAASSLLVTLWMRYDSSVTDIKVSESESQVKSDSTASVAPAPQRDEISLPEEATQTTPLSIQKTTQRRAQRQPLTSSLLTY